MTSHIIIPYIQEPTITKACFEWCKEGIAGHENNLVIEGMTIPLIALLSLFVHYLLVTYGHILLEKAPEISEEKLLRFTRLTSLFPMYLLIGFFIWFIYFT